MNNFCTVADCGRPAQEMLCTGCLTELVTALRELASGGVHRVRHHLHGDEGLDIEPERVIVTELRPGLIEELEATIARLAVSGKVSIGVIAPSAETPLVFHEAASELNWVLRNTISTWARDFAESNDHLQFTPTTTTEAAAWLGKFPALLAMHAAADEMHDEITSTVARVRQMIDRAPDRVYFGKCEAEFEGVMCTEELYGRKDAHTVHCVTCGVEHIIDTRRQMLMDRLDDKLATAAELSRGLPALVGKPLALSTIRSWVARDQLLQRPPDPRDSRRRPRYRVGDVLTLLLPENTQGKAS